RLRKWWFNRYFAGEYCWSSDYRYLALAEWLERVESPQTELRIIDVVSRREVGFGRSVRGFVSPVRWEGSRLVFAVSLNRGGGREAPVERVDVSSLRGWRRIAL